MAATKGFEGYTQEAPRFLADLEKNNNTAWFHEHKARYENVLKKPSERLLGELLAGVQAFLPEIQDGRLFRINRDLRFSRDPSPYKTHVALMLFDPKMKAPACACLYFHLERAKTILGAGVHAFEGARLEAYRRAVVDPEKGPALARLLKKLDAYAVGGSFFKKTPRGYDPHHPNAPYLLHKGLYLALEQPLPKQGLGPELVHACLGHYKKLVPLYRWLSAL